MSEGLSHLCGGGAVSPVWGRGCLTCACAGGALGHGGGGVVPLGRALQQVVQAPEAARQVAQEALFARAVLVGQPPPADVGGGVGGRVSAGVAQRLVGVRALETQRFKLGHIWIIRKSLQVIRFGLSSFNCPNECVR